MGQERGSLRKRASPGSSDEDRTLVSTEDSERERAGRDLHWHGILVRDKASRLMSNSYPPSGSQTGADHTGSAP